MDFDAPLAQARKSSSDKGECRTGGTWKEILKMINFK
jgi:hypothetical protein